MENANFGTECVKFIDNIPDVFIFGVVIRVYFYFDFFLVGGIKE